MLDNSDLEDRDEMGERSTTKRGGFHALKDKFENMISVSGGRLGMAPKEGKLREVVMKKFDWEALVRLGPAHEYSPKKGKYRGKRPLQREILEFPGDQRGGG